MSTNSLKDFKQLFLKKEDNIQHLLSLIFPYLKEKDTAIATYLAVEKPELI